MTLTVNGQNHFIGIKGGVSLTNFKTTGFLNDENYRTCLATGLTYDYTFKKYFSTGLDIIYSQRGINQSISLRDEEGNNMGKAKAKIGYYYNYITFPLKLGINYGNKIYCFGNIGLIPAILVDAKFIIPTINFNGNTFPKMIDNITKKVNSFDIGGFIEIGSGYKFYDRLLVYSSFLFHHSFTSITNQQYFTEIKIWHYGMTLSLGLKYTLTKG